MKKTKKLLSLIMSAMMISSLYVPSAYAENSTVVYSYQNDSGETINVTQEDINDGHWNIDYMSQMPIEQYQDFPVMLESEVNNDATLSLSATYLKVLGENDSASFTISENNTQGTEYYESDFDEEKLTVATLPMNKILNLTVSEIIDNVTNTYTYTIRTYYRQATMPENVSIFNEAHDMLGIDAGKLRIKDVTLGTTEGETEDGEYIFDEHVVYLTPSELPAYYQSITDDHLYSIQASTGEDIYKGFISKNISYDCEFIFTPAFSKYDPDAISLLSSNDLESEYDIRIESDDLVKMKILNFYTDTYMYLDHGWLDGGDVTTSRRLIRMNILENGNHRIRTFGNIPSAGFYCVSTTPLDDNTHNPVPLRNADWLTLGNPNEPTSVDKTIAIAEGSYLYMLIITTDEITDNGSVTASISYTGSSDSISNSKQDVILNGGTTSFNTPVESVIDYYGDVDVFKFPQTTDGKHSLILTNSANVGSIKQELYYSCNDDYLFEMDEASTPSTVEHGHTMCYDYNMYGSSDYTYLLEIKSTNLDPDGNTDYYTGGYTFEMRQPNKPDAYEEHGSYEDNDNYIRAYDISNETSPITDLTLCKADKDYYKFTTGAGGADVSVSMNTVDLCTDPYLIRLEDSDTGVWESTYVGVDKVINATIGPNQTCYIIVTRNNSSNYCPGHPYSLSWTITPNSVYTATLNGNVSLSATTGEADLSAIRQSIAQSTTFKEDDTVVPTAAAIEDMELYYVNGETEIELTSDALNSLTGVYILLLPNIMV